MKKHLYHERFISRTWQGPSDPHSSLGDDSGTSVSCLQIVINSQKKQQHWDWTAAKQVNKNHSCLFRSWPQQWTKKKRLQQRELTQNWMNEQERTKTNIIRVWNENEAHTLRQIRWTSELKEAKKTKLNTGLKHKRTSSVSCFLFSPHSFLVRWVGCFHESGSRGFYRSSQAFFLIFNLIWRPFIIQLECYFWKNVHVCGVVCCNAGLQTTVNVSHNLEQL